MTLFKSGDLFKGGENLFKGGKREMLNTQNAKILAVNDELHRELKNDYNLYQQYTRAGWRVYAITEEGIFYFLDNRDMDGADWCKITKEE